jgi:hypothetical protein
MLERAKEEHPITKAAGVKVVDHVPLMAFAVAADSIRNFVRSITGESKIFWKELPIIQPFTCETCGHWAQICPNPECFHVWRLEQFPKGYSTVVYPICLRELAYL